MKHLLLTATAVMTAASFAFGADEPTYPDTIHAMPIVHPDGWSKMCDSEGSNLEVSGKAGEDAALTLTRVAKPEGKDVWASALGAMFPMDDEGTPQGGSFAKLKYVVIGYKVEKETDTLAITIAKDWNTSTGAPDWNGFNAISAKGASDVGNFVYDTIALSSFFISWAGDNYPDGTLLSDPEAAEYLASCNNFSLKLESDDYENEQVFNLTVKEINFIGEEGLRTDFGLEPLNVGEVAQVAKIDNIVNGIVNGKLNITVPVIGSYDITLHTANGRLIEQSTVSATALTQDIPVKQLSSGVYLVSVSGNGVNVSEKITIQ